MNTKTKSDTTQNFTANPFQNTVLIQRERQEITNQRSNSPRASNTIIQEVSQNTGVVKSLFEAWLIDHIDSQLIYSGILYNFSLNSILMLRLVSKTIGDFIANLRINQESSLLDLLVNKINFSFQIINIFPKIEDGSLITEKLAFCIKNGIKIALNIFGSLDIQQLQKQILEAPNSELFSKIGALNFFCMHAIEKNIIAINALLATISANTHLCSNLRKLFFHGIERIELPVLPHLESLTIENFNIIFQENAASEQIKELNIIACKGDPGLLRLLPNLKSLSFQGEPSIHMLPDYEPDPIDLAEAREEEAIALAITFEDFDKLVFVQEDIDPFMMIGEGMGNIDIEETKNIGPVVCTLPESLNSLKTLHIDNIDNGSTILEFPQSLTNLHNLIIGEKAKNITLPALDNLESFIGTNLSESMMQSLQGSVDTLVSFTCGYIGDDIALSFLCLLKNLRNFSITLGSYKSLKLPNTMDNLTHVIIDISQKACMELPNLLTSLVELKIGEICRNGRLKLPDQLDNLTSLMIGSIHNTAVLELPDRIDNLKTLYIDNIHSKFKLLNSENEILEFASLLPKLINLEHLTIVRKEKLKERKFNYHSDEEYGEYSYEEEYDEYDDSWRTYKLPKSVIDTSKINDFNLPISLREVNIQAISANLILHSEGASNLIMLTIENVTNNVSCFFQNSFNNFASLTIGVVEKDSHFKIEGSCNNLRSLTINYIRENAICEIVIPLDELITLKIDNICDEWYEDQTYLYEELDDYYQSCDYYGRSANHVTIPDPYHKGGALKLLGQLPKLKNLIIKGECARRDEEGKFFIATEEDAIKKLLEMINSRI